MKQQIQAIFENGVFRPLEPLRLPESQRVQLVVEQIGNSRPDEGIQQRRTFLKLREELANLPNAGCAGAPPISDLDRTIYGNQP